MIQIKDLSFKYGEGDFCLRVPDLSIDTGSHVALIGPSGTGKSTLLNLLAGILQCQHGDIVVADKCFTGCSDAFRRTFRLNNIGLVFQSFALMSYLTVYDNVLLPLRLSGAAIDRSAESRCKELINAVGLEGYENRFPSQLSQGQQQRVAICRSLINQPKVVLADEPTGNLDHDNAETVLELMSNQVRQSGATLVMSTHDRSLFDSFDKVIDINTIQEAADEN